MKRILTIVLTTAALNAFSVNVTNYPNKTVLSSDDTFTAFNQASNSMYNIRLSTLSSMQDTNAYNLFVDNFYNFLFNAGVGSNQELYGDVGQPLLNWGS